MLRPLFCVMDIIKGKSKLLKVFLEVNVKKM